MRDLKLGKLYVDGEAIFNEGDHGDSMYIIQKGTVNIVKQTDSGDAIVGTLTKGDIFGEMALFDRLPRSATAIAEGEARILSVDKKRLFSTVKRDPTVVFNIIRSMSDRIRKLDDQLAKLTDETEF